MLSDFFAARWRMRALRDGPGGALLEGFAHALSEMRYAAITARRHLRSAEHFIDWADRHDLAVPDVTAEALDRFAHHLTRCRCQYAHAKRVDVLKGARIFATYLRDAHVIPAAALEAEVQDPGLLTEFCTWMRQQRGTCPATLANYRGPIRDVLRQLGEVPSRWDVHRLRACVVEKSRTSGWAAAKQCTTALRMFLRCLIAGGHCAVGFDAAIPTVAHWRLAALPRYFQPAEVERVIASCDRTTAVGRRDRAILLLLARLGLRAGDIVQLRLRDIDWRDAWIWVSGKSRRPTHLPLSQEVGQAIVTYLREGRPQTAADTVFVTCRAPFRPFSSHCVVSVIVDRALRRAGVRRPSRGAAHLLRHSLATSLLREGGTLQDIATVLRHRSIQTTQIYAKVDVTALQSIAQPWPVVQPC
jgi:site-specific recombinase XerD